jgi:hypothetical protein
MAKIFNIYLKNNVSATDEWDERDMFTVGNELKILFDKVCQLNDSGFAASDYWLDPGRGEIAPHELLVYFINDSGASIIEKAHSNANIDLTKSGNTYFLGNQPRISEVYVLPVLKFRDCHKILANLCFHELMHNKLEPFNVHLNGGGGLATDGTITSSTPLSDKNKELMAKALEKRTPQYKDAL